MCFEGITLLPSTYCSVVVRGMKAMQSLEFMHEVYVATSEGDGENSTSYHGTMLNIMIMPDYGEKERQ